MQDIADEMDRKKSEVEVILKVIDDLENRYYSIAETIKKKSTNNAG